MSVKLKDGRTITNAAYYKAIMKTATFKNLIRSELRIIGIAFAGMLASIMTMCIMKFIFNAPLIFGIAVAILYTCLCLVLMYKSHMLCRAFAKANVEAELIV
jgi:hypothetical protein